MAKKPAGTSRRKRFGKDGKAWINVEISSSGRQAFLRELCLGGDDSIGEEDLVRALEELYRITTGIDGEVIERVLRQARTEPHKEYFGLGDLIIAREVSPQPSRNAQVQHKFLDILAKRVDLPYLELKAAFEKDALADVIAQDLQVRAARPDEELAVLLPPQRGIPGQDIFGNILSLVPAPENVRVKAGANVRQEEDRFVSEIYGYICVTDDEIAVLSPLWISPDGMEVHYIHFPQVGPQFLPETGWLEHLLERERIHCEIPTRVVKELTRHLMNLRTRKGHFLLAQGRPPVPGRDARLECRLDANGDEDAEADARKTTLGVRSGQLVAAAVPPTKGAPGLNLWGEEVPAQEGRRIVFKAGENVRIQYEDNYPKFFYSKTDGNARIDGTRVDVFPVLHIDGDVDEGTGDIDAVKDVVVSGSVCGEVKVKASGNITVGNCIEGGASVSARGDVLVAEGILGARTKIIALGDVYARFVRDGSVMARRNVILGEYARDARIRAGEKLVVQPGDAPRSGSVVGGETTATRGVEAETLGSPAGDFTRVEIGPDLEIEAKLNKVREGMDFYNENILRIFRTLDIQSIDLPEVRELLNRTPPWRKKSVVDLLMKLKTLVNRREASIRKQKNLETQRMQALQGSEIRVRNRAFANTGLRIGEGRLTLEQDLERPVFFAGPEGVAWRSI